MAEFEAQRGMPADADTVFAVVSDLDRLSQWMPGPVDVQLTGDGEVHADVEPRGVDADGLVRVRPEQLRVEWGHAPDYAGWLQVEHADPGRSSVVLHLSFLGDQPETHGGEPAAEVQQWLDDGLGRLENLVAQG
ncbi:SRPBCC family protein [Pseudonocardia nigra]|uniref:SRPBCC family protein n=1 Tax=Pseudonocardia nigra TaxID=1921578 RepID=UPI001C5D991F|nr:SRPBCC family protein [Pseudonocardia nigra]